MRIAVPVKPLLYTTKNVLRTGPHYWTLTYVRPLWVRKLIIKAIKRFGGRVAQDTDFNIEIAYTYFDFENQDLVDQIHEQMHSLKLGGLDPERIIVGYEKLKELKVLTSQSYDLNFTEDILVRPFDSLYMTGLPIQIVPWMDGLLVIPKMPGQ